VIRGCVERSLRGRASWADLERDETDRKILDIVFRIDQDACLDALVKHIEQELKERGFCFAFEDELDRCWASKNIQPAELERQIQDFANSRGWSVSLFNTYDGPTRAMFEYE